jgi:hypothetical protein
MRLAPVSVVSRRIADGVVGLGGSAKLMGNRKTACGPPASRDFVNWIIENQRCLAHPRVAQISAPASSAVRPASPPRVGKSRRPVSSEPFPGWAKNLGRRVASEGKVTGTSPLPFSVFMGVAAPVGRVSGRWRAAETVL